jgi:hypothetical protein
VRKGVFTTLKQKKTRFRYMSEKELIEELLKLQISQTATLTRLLEASISRSSSATEQGATSATEQDDKDRPLEIGDSVTVITSGRFDIRRNTVCTVVKIGKRVTIETPNGTRTYRAAHNLRRVTKK